MIGQGLNSLYLMAHLSEDQAKTTVSVTLIAITALLTAFGVFDKIARHAGAGTIVPITGFANAVVSPGDGVPERGPHSRHRRANLFRGGASDPIRAGCRSAFMG